MINEFQYRLLNESAITRKVKNFAEEVAKALRKQYPYLYPYKIGMSVTDTDAMGFIEYPKSKRVIKLEFDDTLKNVVIYTFTNNKLEFKSKLKRADVKTVMAYMKMVEGDMYESDGILNEATSKKEIQKMVKKIWDILIRHKPSNDTLLLVRPVWAKGWPDSRAYIGIEDNDIFGMGIIPDEIYDTAKKLGIKYQAGHGGSTIYTIEQWKKILQRL